MLYWAEGAKGRNTIKFTNSDPQMVLFFRRFLTDALAIAYDKIVMTLNVYTNNGICIGPNCVPGAIPSPTTAASARDASS